MMEKDFGQKNRQSSAEKAYHWITERIEAKEINPSDHLNELRISRELEINRAAVKSALGRLIDEGLAEKKTNRRIYVSRLEHSERNELLGFRAVLESGAAWFAAKNREEKDLAELNHLIDDHVYFVKREYWHGIFEIEKRFHHFLVAVSRNMPLMKAYDNSKVMFMLTLHQDVRDIQLSIVIPDHRAIVKALADKDCEAAFRNTWEHVMNAKFDGPA